MLVNFFTPSFAAWRRDVFGVSLGDASGLWEDCGLNPKPYCKDCCVVPVTADLHRICPTTV